MAPRDDRHGAGATIAVDPADGWVCTATGDGRVAEFALKLRVAGEHLALDPGGTAPGPIEDWIDQDAVLIGDRLWHPAAVLAALVNGARTAHGRAHAPVVLVIPAWFGAVRRARLATALAGTATTVCDSARAVLLGSRVAPPVVVLETDARRTIAVHVDDHGPGPADGRVAVIAGDRYPESATASGEDADGDPAVLRSDRRAGPGAGADRAAVLRGALIFGRQGTDPPAAAS